MKKDQFITVTIITLLLFLSVTLGMVVLSEKAIKASEWSLNTSFQRTDTMYVGSNDTFITIDGNLMYAIGQTGELKWDLRLPEPEGGMADFSDVSIYQAATIDDCTCFLVRPKDLVLWQGEGEIVAISGDGQLLWSQPCYTLYNARLYAANHTIYLYNTHDITAIDQNGTMQWKISSIFYPPAVAESGDIYAIQYQYPDDGWILQSYTSDGRIAWGRNLSELGMGQVYSNSIYSIAGHDNLIYVFLNDGVAAIDSTGSLAWTKSYGVSTFPMGFDSADRIYVVQAYPSDRDYYYKIRALTPDGDEVAARDLSANFYFNSLLSDGILYEMTPGHSPDGGLDDLSTLTISAFDVIEGELLWDEEISPRPRRTVTLDSESASMIFPWYQFEPDFTANLSVDEIEIYSPAPDYPGVKNQTYQQILTGDQMVYVSFWAFNYETPVVYGESKCTYAGGLYAYDRDGNLLWKKQTDSYVIKMTEQNGTVYYETRDGGFSAATVDVAAGLIAATVYLILRFLVAGTITRARSKLDKNLNRNAIHELICERPGLTQHDLARQLGFNIGTVRYHLLVLTLNHKISAYTDDTKFIRYFKNSHSYTEDEKRAIALVRREPMRRLLALIAEGRCSSNIELSQELDMPQSAVSKYLRELQESGVITRNIRKKEGSCYAIEERYRTIFNTYFAAPGYATDQIASTKFPRV
ncbi:winged helix-turn-helix transcriptional regulator [Methanocella sp. MCL-LM]|uniref:winged helix-turn-helix transcriptional regulator n=1 Tax=Methanocella sp. MCL-LM TaxID=3412035 RepID=UPI003C78375D